MRIRDAHLNLTVQGQWPDRHRRGIPHHSQVMIDKQHLRRQLRRQRLALDTRQLLHASDAVIRQLNSLPLFRRAQRLGFYMASNGEIDLDPLLQQSLQQGKQCFLPVLHPFHDSRLWFVQWQQEQALHANRYGIVEPVAHHARIIKPYALDMVLVPMLGFDEQGNRLGMGKGYYDRCFSYLRRHRQWHRPRLIGIAHEFQKAEGLQADTWDIPLDLVITERSIYGPFDRHGRE